jgi:hypothetical protein
VTGADVVLFVLFVLVVLLALWALTSFGRGLDEAVDAENERPAVEHERHWGGGERRLRW